MPELLINVDVDDLEKAIDFYTRALGLKLGRRFDSKFVEILGASSPIYFLVEPGGSSPWKGSPQHRNYLRHWTPIHLDFSVPNIEEAIQRAQAAGARLEGEIRDFNYGRLANLSDPFGHGFCLLEFKGKGYGEIVPSP